MDLPWFINLYLIYGCYSMPSYVVSGILWYHIELKYFASDFVAGK